MLLTGQDVNINDTRLGRAATALSLVSLASCRFPSAQSDCCGFTARAWIMCLIQFTPVIYTLEEKRLQLLAPVIPSQGSFRPSSNQCLIITLTKEKPFFFNHKGIFPHKHQCCLNNQIFTINRAWLIIDIELSHIWTFVLKKYMQKNMFDNLILGITIQKNVTFQKWHISQTLIIVNSYFFSFI